MNKSKMQLSIYYTNMHDYIAFKAVYELYMIYSSIRPDPEVFFTDGNVAVRPGNSLVYLTDCAARPPEHYVQAQNFKGNTFVAI